MDLKKGIFKPVYLLTGSDAYAKHRLINYIKARILKQDDEFNFLQLDKVEAGSDVLVTAESMPVSANRRLIIVKDEDLFVPEKLSQKMKTSLQTYLKNPNPSTCLVFYAAAKVDKRGSLYKEIAKQGGVIELNVPKGQKLMGWIRKAFNKAGKKPDQALVAFLAATSGGNLFFLENEIAKILAYAADLDIIKLVDVQGVIAKTTNAGIFQMMDYLAEGAAVKTIRELRKLLDTGQHPILINNMLARQYRLMLKVKIYQQVGCSPGDLMKKLKLSPYVASKLSAQARSYSIGDLALILKRFAEFDLLLKGSSIRPQQDLEMLILELIKNQ